MLAAGSFAALAIAYVAELGIADLLPLSTSSFLATYVLSMAAAVRLLDGRATWMARVALAACIGVLAFAGIQIVWLIAVMLAAVIYAVWAERSKARLAKAQLDSFTP